jgi:hypothetical protein
LQSSQYKIGETTPPRSQFLPFAELAHSLLKGRHQIGPGGIDIMYDRDFFTSKLGMAALVSIAAMVTFNVVALTQQLGNAPEAVVVAGPVVELA